MVFKNSFVVIEHFLVKTKLGDSHQTPDDHADPSIGSKRHRSTTEHNEIYDAGIDFDSKVKHHNQPAMMTVYKDLITKSKNTNTKK